MTVVLIVSPAGHASRGQQFDGRVDGRLIVTRSPTPFLDAARALLADGVDPGAVLVMRHAGDAHDALRSTVSKAAGISIADDKLGKPVMCAYRPYNGQRSPAVSDSSEVDAASATLVPSDTKASPRQPGDTFSEAAL